MRNALVGQGRSDQRWSVHALAALAAVTVCGLLGVPGVGIAAASSPYADDPRFRDAAADAREQARTRDDRRATAAERDERVQSRTTHRGLGRGEARALARRSFGMLAADVWRPLRLGDGERFAGYLDDFAAEIERDGQEPLLARTFVPMRDRDAAGTVRRVSLALRDQATAVVADNPLVDVSIAKAADGPLRLERSGIAVRALLDTVQGEVQDDRVFAESVATDLDQIIQPTTLGAVPVAGPLAGGAGVGAAAVHAPRRRRPAPDPR